MSLPTDNVVPIDAEAARALAKRATRFRWFVAVVTVAWVGAMAAVMAFTPLPPLAPLVAMSVLVVLAEHRFVLFGDETSMSGSIIIVVASVFVFADTAPFAGPMLVASMGGLYLPHLRQRELMKIALNSAGMALAALTAAALTTELLRHQPPSLLRTLETVLIATIIYWFANNLVVATYLAARSGDRMRTVFRVLLTSETGILVWAGLASTAIAAAPSWLIQVAVSAAFVWAQCITIAHVPRGSVVAREARSYPSIPLTLIAWGLVAVPILFAHHGEMWLLGGLFAVVIADSRSLWLKTTRPQLVLVPLMTGLVLVSGSVVLALLSLGMACAVAAAVFLHPYPLRVTRAVASSAGVLVAGQVADMKLAIHTPVLIALLVVLAGYLTSSLILVVQLGTRRSTTDARVLMGLLMPSTREVGLLALAALAATSASQSVLVAVALFAAWLGATCRYAAQQPVRSLGTAEIASR